MFFIIVVLALLAPTNVWGITAYEAHAMDLKCNKICNGKIDRQVCLTKCMASLQNRLQLHGKSMRARKAILSLSAPRKNRFRHPQPKKQDIFKQKKATKGRKIIRQFINHKKRIH